MERYVHPLLGEITLNRSTRARRVSISVRASGEVRLTFPPHVSQRRALEFLDAKASWVTECRRRLAERAATHPPTPSYDIEALRRAAKGQLPARVEQLARQFGFRYGRVTIRDARTKWGSCSGDNNLSLSLFLMILPPHLRDFVLLHELCHTLHHNHSPRFHALLDRLCGGKEKLLSRELRSYAIPPRQ